MAKGNNPFDLLDDRRSTEVALDELEAPKQDFKGNVEAELYSEPDTEDVVEEEESAIEEEYAESEAKDKEDSDYTVEIDGNPIYLLAKKWQEEGRFPEDVEITEDLKEDDFDKILYEYKEKHIYNDLRQKALEELAEKEGLTDESIKAAKMFHYGVADEDLRAVNLFKALANVKLDPDSDDYEDSVRELGMAFYIKKDFSAEQAERYVKRDLMEDNIDSIVADYQKFFDSSAKDLESSINLRLRQEEQDRLVKKQESVKLINTLLDKGVIDGVKYSKSQIDAAKKALFDKTELVQDTNGNSRLVTLEQRKTLEIKSDPEKRLKARIDFILGTANNSDDSDAVIKATKSLTSGLKKMVKIQPRVDISRSTDSNRVRRKDFEVELT